MVFEVSEILVVWKHIFFLVIHLWGTIKKLWSCLNLPSFPPQVKESNLAHKKSTPKKVSLTQIDYATYKIFYTCYFKGFLIFFLLN